ncbi:MAG: CPBP family intramembrane metalloprotease, partial [Candidatus Latescibacteria bacterium]|nr:CPBP family intramembrane metalloprotease [Candidatus Latescibacterota bacterium]
LIGLLLRHRGHSRAHAWGSYSFERKQLGLIVLAGIAFASTANLAVNLFGLDSPPAAPAWDWRLSWASEILTLCLAVPIAEELLFRGLLYRAFRLRFTALDSALFSSLIFALTHTQYYHAPFMLVSVLLMGMVSSSLLERTSSLTPGITFHVSSNMATTAIRYLSLFSL